MPQLSSNSITCAAGSGSRSADAETIQLLNVIMQSLDLEICTALMSDDNALAERLNIPFMQAKKLALLLVDPTERA